MKALKMKIEFGKVLGALKEKQQDNNKFIRRKT
jgi:hypothetical protein